MIEKGALRSPDVRRKSVVAISSLLFAGTASAIPVDIGNPDFDISWTNSFAYDLGMRTQAQRAYIVNSTSGSGDLKFKQGNINTSRLDVLSELVVKYRNNYGFRISADAWYDPAYHDKSAPVNPTLGASGYTNNQYSYYTKRYYSGPSGELLDAYVFGKFYAGSVPINFKVGRHTLYFGEGLFSNTYAVSDSQSPVDGIKGSSAPGAQVKTLFLPLAQISAQAQLTRNVSLTGQYFLEWAPSRFPAGGTYFGAVDFLYRGPNQLAIPGVGTLPQQSPVEPKNAGNFGFLLQWNVEPLQTKFGFVYRKFDDYTPWVAPEVTSTGYKIVYPKDTQLFGVTAAREVYGASVGAELSYRKNTALSPSGINALTNEGPTGNTWNAVLNSLWLLDKTRFYDTGNLSVEFTFNRLGSVTKNADLYNGVGYGTCTYKWNGCATKNFVGLAAQFDPQWLQVFPSVDIDTPIFLNYGLYGNAADNGGGYQGSATYSIGVNARFQQKYDLTLSYEGFYARTHNQGAVVEANGNMAYNDKGWVFITFKAGF
ncbi:MAG: DUF1302 domain-containing protein [Janthinobacterium lividum]